MTEPKPEELEKFLDALLEKAPEGYTPWLFRVEEGSKSPDLRYGSWKEERARLTREEAVEWMESGGNVGIAGTDEDRLVNVDIDDEDETDEDDLKPTLVVRSRSRIGRHHFYFSPEPGSIPNIPTDEKGEIRANWQYVVAPGSYVDPSDVDEIPEEEEDLAGYYTVEDAHAATRITLDELPPVFKKTYHENNDGDEPPDTEDGEGPSSYDGKSDLYDVTARDVVQKEGGDDDESERWESLFHGSDTGENMSYSSEGKIHCWRHNVAHNGLQALVVLSGYDDCMSVGTPHKGSGAGSSSLSGGDDDGAIWRAWKYAKENGYIPDDDPAPYRALKHLCREHDLCAATEIPSEYDPDDGKTLPLDAYNGAVETIEDEYGLTPGREQASGTSKNRSTPYESPESLEASDDDRTAEEEEAEDDDADLPACAPEDPAGDLVVSKGCYGYNVDVGRDEEKWVWKQVSNFLLETLEFVETDDGVEMRIRVHPAHPREDSYEVTVEPTVFNETRQFKQEIVTGRTTQFEAHRPNTLNELRETVGAQIAPERAGVSHLGAATEDLDELVTPNGVLGADGWIEDPNHRYYAKASSDSDDASIVGDKWALTPEDDDEYDEDEVREILERLPNARLPDRALATLGWFYSAPAKPLVHDEEGEFNHLHIRGKTESGKTSYLEALYEAFGMKSDPWSASATGFSLEQLHVGSRGVPVWIDEYKPSDMHSRTRDTLHRYLRIATREGVWTKGRPDQSHMKFQMQSPVVLSGEQQVSEPAVRRRMIQVNLSERATEDRQHVKAYSELAGEPYEDENGNTETPRGLDLRQHALAYYRFLLSRDAGTLRDVWHSARTATARFLDELGMTLQDTEFQGAQTVVFGYRLYQRFAREMGLSDAALPDEDLLRESIRHLSENVGANGQRREHGDEFLELVAQAANAGYLTSEFEAEQADDAVAGYRVYNPSATEDEAIALHMPTAYPAVKRYARDYNVEDDYNLLQKSDYLAEFSDLSESADTHVAATSHATKICGATKRCVLLEARAAHEKLGSNFDLSAFGIHVDDDPEVQGSEDPDDGGGSPSDHPKPVAVGEIDPSRQDTASTIGVVEFQQWDGRNTQNANAPAWTATLKDETGEAELVAWEKTDIPPFYDDFGAFEADALHVKGAETSEYDGRTQLVIGEETVVESAQVGAGETSIEDPGDGQDQLNDAGSSQTAEADGGQETASTGDETDGDGEGVPEDAEGALADARRLVEELQHAGDPLGKADLFGRVDMPPARCEDALDHAVHEKGLIAETDDGLEPT